MRGKNKNDEDKQDWDTRLATLATMEYRQRLTAARS